MHLVDSLKSASKEIFETAIRMEPKSPARIPEISYILAEGAIALSVTHSGGALFAS